MIAKYRVTNSEKWEKRINSGTDFAECPVDLVL